MQIDDVYEIPKPIFWEKNKNVISLLSAEWAQRMLKFKMTDKTMSSPTERFCLTEQIKSEYRL